jgi:hypothetical protein
MDLRSTPGNEHWDDWNVSGLGKPPAGDHVFFWFLRTHDGLSITSVYPDTEVSQVTIPELCQRITEIMSSVARTGSYAIRPAERLSA